MKHLLCRFKNLAVLLIALLISQATFAVERVTYYHLDALGSPVAATDKDGNIRWREHYRPFGERIDYENEDTSNDNRGPKNTAWYTGKIHHEDIGLSYYGARWYDPALGRFTGVDPVGFQDENIHSFNRYAYANNNPYLFIDPNGEEPLDIVKGYLNALADSNRFAVGLPFVVANYAGFSFNFQYEDQTTGEVSQFIANLGGSAAGVLKPVATKIAPEVTKALVPKAIVSLGIWGEIRLAIVLGNAGSKPANAFTTSLGKRYIDRLVNGVGHEAKAGLNVGLTSSIRKQILKDAELIAAGRLQGAHWHFFQGVQLRTTDFLRHNGISFTIH